jgi:hypothetical protein
VASRSSTCDIRQISLAVVRVIRVGKRKLQLAKLWFVRDYCTTMDNLRNMTATGM